MAEVIDLTELEVFMDYLLEIEEDLCTNVFWTTVGHQTILAVVMLYMLKYFWYQTSWRMHISKLFSHETHNASSANA